MTTSVIVLLVGMQLFYHNYYYDINIAKYRYYLICSIVPCVLCIGYVVFIDRDKLKLKGKKIGALFNWTDIMVLMFMTVSLISTLLSPFKYEAFWGNEGRLTGSFLITVYSVYYFCATRFYRQSEWHIDLFLLAGILMSLFGISDSFDLDILGFKKEIAYSIRYIFTSTIGNINVYTACVAMVMATAVVLFVSSKSLTKNVWYGFCVVVTFFALIIGESDNAYLSLALLFGFIPLYLFRKKGGIRKYVMLLAMFFTVVYVIGIEQRVFEGIVVPITSLFVKLARFNALPVLVICLWMLVFILYIIEYKKKENSDSKEQNDEEYFKNSNSHKTPISIYVWCGIIIAICCIVLWMLYDVNVAGNTEKYAGLENYLLLNDEWGSRRGFAWRVAIENYCKFSFVQKLFGYGPETFGLITYFHNYKEMVSQAEAIFDNVHNEYLQYLITIGALGLCSYLGIIVTLTWNVAKKKADNPIAIACLFAVLCYAAQATVNIGLPISTPIMWTLLCITAAKQPT